VDSDSPVAFGGATSNLDGISRSNGARIIVMRALVKGSFEVHTLVLISSAVVTIQFARAVIVENGANGMTSWHGVVLVLGEVPNVGLPSPKNGTTL
jgi:hypothetical protein